jgi:biotin carboxyl carrier protein
MPEEHIECPIPGKIVAVLVAVGDLVSEGDELLILESMKMENPLLTPIAGRVKRIDATSGQTVKGGEILIVIDY